MLSKSFGWNAVLEFTNRNDNKVQYSCGLFHRHPNFQPYAARKIASLPQGANHPL